MHRGAYRGALASTGTLMADDATPTDTPNPQPDAPEQPNPPASADAPKSKTYTEEELNAIVASRLSKHEKSLRKQFDEQKAEELKRSRMEKSERLEAELGDLKSQLEAERQARTNAERRAALTGKVADPQAALRLLDEQQHLDEDGNVSVEALLETYPFLAPQSAKAPSVGGSSRPAQAADEPGDLPTQIRKAEEAGDWDAAFRLKNRLYAQQRLKSQ